MSIEAITMLSIFENDKNSAITQKLQALNLKVCTKELWID
jgi:hypothetical protein